MIPYFPELPALSYGGMFLLYMGKHITAKPQIHEIGPLLSLES
jgi:hypothetical protein